MSVYHDYVWSNSAGCALCGGDPIEPQHDARLRRLVHNEVIRQRNKQRNAELEQRPRRPLTTIVMNPKG